jgi:hypothetical protein
MFLMLVVFIVSLILEVMLLTFIPPEQDGKFNHFAILFFSVNTGVLLGVIYSFILLAFYITIKAYSDLQRRAFIRRSILFGSFVSIFLLLKIYGFFDTYVMVLSVIIYIALELILSPKVEGK